MSLAFTTTSASVEDQGVKMLVYAPAGHGKTVLIGTMPGKPEESVIISNEAGLLSLQPANQMRLWGEVRDIAVIKIKTAADLGEAYNLIAGPHGRHFRNVSLDSLSEIAETILQFELAVQKDPRKAYGIMADTMTKYIRLFRDLPGKHVYMTAKQDRDKDVNGILLFGPSMPGKQLLQGVDHFFDEVFALCIGEIPATPTSPAKDYRFLRTRPNIQYRAKDRSGALDEIEEPNLSKVIAKIQNRNV